MNEFKFELGSLAKDRITGYKGVVVMRAQWLTNCNTYALQPQELDKDGKPPERQFFDEPNLVLVKEKVFEEPKKAKTGGPTHRIPNTNR